MVPKHFDKIFFICILSSLVPLAHGEGKESPEEEKERIEWIEGKINETINIHGPKHNASKLCDFKIVPTATATAAGETAIDYTTLFPEFKNETDKEPYKAGHYPKLGEVARVGPAEAAKRIRHFGHAFPEKLRNSSDLAKLYSATSGLMAREARWERNVYCADWMAHMLQKLAYVNLTASVVLVNTVVYQPFKVAVKEKVVIMTNVLNDIKVNLTKFVDSLEKNMMNASENANIVHMRKLLGEKMDEIAEEEANGKSSSMDFFVNMNYGKYGEDELKGYTDKKNKVPTKPVILRISSVGKKTPMPEDDEKKGTNAIKPTTKKANANNEKKGNNAAKPTPKKPN
uniref:Uncharacterized protein n=1 Tax=Globodera rostochiensis TaxID=31243 RepID=A0A914HTL5_GLORO